MQHAVCTCIRKIQIRVYACAELLISYLQLRLHLQRLCSFSCDLRICYAHSNGIRKVLLKNNTKVSCQQQKREDNNEIQTRAEAAAKELWKGGREGEREQCGLPDSGCLLELLPRLLWPVGMSLSRSSLVLGQLIK